MDLMESSGEFAFGVAQDVELKGLSGLTPGASGKVRSPLTSQCR